MAEEIVIKTVLDLSESERKLKDDIGRALNSPQVQTKAKEAGEKIGAGLGLGIESGTRRAKGGVDSLLSSVSALKSAFVALGAVGAISFLENLARKSIDAAIAIDRQVNSLKALTGSAEAAKQRFAELFAIAQRTPGLTTTLATTLDAQLRIFNVAERTIDRLLPVIGRLNAISPLGDPRQFVNNLTQLISQNFERQDLKELVGASPIAGQLIKQIFNVDNPTNAEAIRAAAKRLSINTVERLAEEFIEAGATNTALKNATENLATQFEKLNERIQVAIAPIGDELLKTILPAFKQFVELIERDAPKITKLLEDNKEEIIAVASAFLTMTDAVGQLIGKFSELNQQFGIIRALSVLAVAITPGGAGSLFTLLNTFGRADATRPVISDFSSAVRPSGEELRRRALASGDLQELRRADQIIAEENRNRPRDSSIATGGDREASRAAKERLKEIKDANENLSKALDKRMQSVVDDLSEIEKVITGANLENVRREGERPGQLRSFGAATAARLRKIDLETLRLEENTRQATIEELQRTGRRDLTRSGRFIGAAVSRGQLTAGEAEALSQEANREFANTVRQALALEKEKGQVNQANIDQLEEEIALYDQLGTAISNTERFARGFNSAIETTGDAFDRFGQNVSNAFRDVSNVFDGLKRAVLGFFNDLLGQSLQNLFRQAVSPLLGGIAGAFGGPSFAGAAGNIFRTPSIFPAAIAQAFAGGGGGITAPPSISSGGPSTISPAISRFAGASVPGSAGSPVNLPFAPAGFSDALLKGAGFGSAAKPSFLGGITQSLAAAAPLLGLSFGSSLGGQSIGGKILGGVGGALVGLSASTGFLGGALLTNPFTAIAGIGLLIGGALLGKAKQRRQDEQASGEMLTAALQGIEQLRDAIATDQIDGSQAGAIFQNQILGQFIRDIGTLKTESVRRSRLTNQVADLQKVYRESVEPQITAQAARRQAAIDADAAAKAEEAARLAKLQANALIHSKLIPEFATGGIAPGGLAFLHDREMVLTVKHQRDIAALAGGDIFNRVGVPGVQSNPVFDNGGVFAGGGGLQPIEVTLLAQIVMGKDDRTRIVVDGLKTSQGQTVIAKSINQLRLNTELG